MSNKQVRSAPLLAWLLAAMSVPLAMVVAAQDYVCVALVALACCLLCGCVVSISGGNCCGGRLYCGIQLLWLILATGVAAYWAENVWQTEKSGLAVSATLLILAALSAYSGAERSSRIGSTVFWLLALLYALILASGIGNLKTQWLVPRMERCSPMMIFALLIPVVITFLPRKKEKGIWAVLAVIFALAVVMAVWTVGTISPQVTAKTAFPFYEYSKSLNLFGVVKRLEAFVSVALTMGVYSLLTLFLSGAGCLTEKWFPGKGSAGVVVCAVLSALLTFVVPQIPEMVVGGGALLVWGILPLFAFRKKSGEKSKKGG